LSNGRLRSSDLASAGRLLYLPAGWEFEVAGLARALSALTDAGLPEPELQVQIVPGDSYSPAADMGYRRHRMAIQYDGGHHLTREQQSRDNRRDEAFNSAGRR
jgi:hypothetical protein